jgi:hypothetical protein
MNLLKNILVFNHILHYLPHLRCGRDFAIFTEYNRGKGKLKAAVNAIRDQHTPNR